MRKELHLRTTKASSEYRCTEPRFEMSYNSRGPTKSLCSWILDGVDDSTRDHRDAKAFVSNTCSCSDLSRKKKVKIDFGMVFQKMQKSQQQVS